MGEEFRETPYYMYSNPYHSMKARMKVLSDMSRDDDYYKDR